MEEGIDYRDSFNAKLRPDLTGAPAGHLPGAAWLMALHENALDACRGRKCVSRAKASEAIPNFGLCN